MVEICITSIIIVLWYHPSTQNQILCNFQFYKNSQIRHIGYLAILSGYFGYFTANSSIEFFAWYLIWKITIWGFIWGMNQLPHFESNPEMGLGKPCASRPQPPSKPKFAPMHRGRSSQLIAGPLASDAQAFLKTLPLRNRNYW